MAHYASTLVRCGYADAQTLRAALPASIAVGHVLDVLYLAEHPMDEPDELQLVRDQLRADVLEEAGDPQAAVLTGLALAILVATCSPKRSLEGAPMELGVSK